MSAPRFVGKPLTSSRIVEALGDDLLRIKSEDRMSWVDVGEVLGCGDDQAARYAAGHATMNVVAYTRGRLVWGSRFTSSVDNMVNVGKDAPDAQKTQTCILHAAMQLSIALQDGDLCENDVRKNRSTLEAARDAIDAQLARLAPKAVA